MMAIVRSESGTHRRSKATAGSTVISTSSCPSSMPTLNASSDSSRLEPGELQLLLQHEREAEAVDQPEQPGHHPAPAQVRAQHVLERHVEDRRGDQHFDQRRKPRARGTMPYAAAISVIEWATVNDVITPTSVPVEAAERQDQAEQEQQVVRRRRGCAGSPT